MKKYIFLFIAILPNLLCISCSGSDNDPVVTESKLSFSSDSVGVVGTATTATLTVSMTGTTWTASVDQSWCTLSTNSSSEKSTDVVISAIENTTGADRTAVITFIVDKKKEETVKIVQKAQPIPDYSNPIAADASGMSSSITSIASSMRIGWNLGNTLEAPGSEIAWGNPVTSQLLIDSIKAAGFNAVRLPVAWNSHLSNSTLYTINTTWLARVKEIVDYCYKNNMYVIINIHWDGGWLEENCTEAKKAVNNVKQKAFWEQIAVYFRNYDEHLLFASANEPNVSDATQMAVLMTYHQTFINAVRSTGGRNAYRALIIQGPSTDISKTATLMTSWPTDVVSNRLMAEVHYYTPWTFCGLTADASWGNMVYYWGTGHLSTTDTSRNYSNGETEMNNLFASMKTKFVDKGIPVILGEFGAVRRSTLTGTNLSTHLDARAYFYECVAKQARNNGIIPFLWDTGIWNSNDMGIFVRSTGVASDRQALSAIKSGVAASTLPY